MSTKVQNIDDATLIRIKKKWLQWSIIVFAVWFALFIFFSFTFGLVDGILWGSISLIIVIWQNFRLFKLLPTNRSTNTSPLLPEIGLANWISLSRGTLIAYLSGFILMSKPANWIMWIPAFLYLFAALLDYIDGIVARLTNSTTILGEKLDMEMDGMGVLIATFVAIQYGQIPIIYILVGLARYLFLAGIFIRQKSALIIKPLSASPFRRGLAGAQMGFLVTVLFPVFKPPVTQIAALFFMTPFLISFFIDWLTVSNANIPVIHNFSLTKFLPIFLRILLLIWIFINFLTVVTVSSINQILLIIMILFSLFGVASRISSFVIMLWCGFFLRQQPENIWVWSLLIISMLIFFTGSGKYSLWKPEDYLLFRRVGE